jgi:phosphohistidine phosphatase SixA
MIRICMVVSAILVFFTSCSHSYYIVRHAEKAPVEAGTVNNDPPLSEAGKVRAFVLRNELLHRHIKHIYSTHTIRAISTAEPLSQATGVKVELYNTKDSLDQFIENLRTIKNNVLVIGHSNTVDDIVNKLCGETKITADLKEYEFDNFFIVKYKGKKIVFTKKKYGYPSNPE